MNTGRGLRTRVRQLINAQAFELPALLWSFLYFFVLLCGYYIIRPMRDEMGIQGGVENLQWLFTGTFVVMLAAVPLFGWVSSRYPRRRFIPYVYLFFIASLLLFWLAFRLGTTHSWVARAFFIWASVFNLFVISVFWSFMADTFSPAQARRLFPVIAAGGTAGALTGPVLTAALAGLLGPTNLLLISAGFLGLAVVCVNALINWRQQQSDNPSHDGAEAPDGGDTAMGGSVLAGFRLVMASPYLLGIALFILLLTTLATFLYFQQAQIIRDSFASSADRTAVFAVIDFTVNALTLMLQLFLTGRIINWLGLGWTLALVPMLLGVGFLLLSTSPLLPILVVVQVIRRAGNYAIMRPAREILFTVVSAQEKYKAKNFIDTVVYRGGDAVSAWVYAAMTGLGLTLAGIAFVAVPIAAAWAGIAWLLGRRQEVLASASESPPPIPAISQ